MKFTLKIFALSTLLIFTGCKKLNELTSFNIRVDSSFTIPSVISIDTPVPLLTPEIETNTEQELSANETRADLVEEITLNSLTLEITSPESQTFDFLKSVEIYVTSDNHGETLVAEYKDIPQDGRQKLEIPTTDNNVREYLLEENFKMKVITTTRQAITQSVEIDVTSVFRVRAELI